MYSSEGQTEACSSQEEHDPGIIESMNRPSYSHHSLGLENAEWSRGVFICMSNYAYGLEGDGIHFILPTIHTILYLAVAHWAGEGPRTTIQHPLIVFWTSQGSSTMLHFTIFTACWIRLSPFPRLSTRIGGPGPLYRARSRRAGVDPGFH